MRNADTMNKYGFLPWNRLVDVIQATYKVREMNFILSMTNPTINFTVYS